MTEPSRTEFQRELIPAPPDLESEYLDRGDQHWVSGRVDEALAAYEEGLEHCAERDLLHKRIAGLLETARGLAAAFDYYGLERLDKREISIHEGEIICGATVRDEADFIPYFLEYHERLGVDRFLIVDNLSQDATREILLSNPKVHVWQTPKRFWPSSCGSAWIEALFRGFARGHWCLVVDADELFYYPDIESRGLREVCEQLDQTGKIALPAVLLDMYSDRPVRDAVYAPGQDPIEVCRFFDRDFFHWRGSAGPWQNFEGFAGGVRRRAFGGDSYPFLSKIPLFRYTTDRVIASGYHSTNAPAEQIASERGAVLHFKFTARFVERLEEERASERRLLDSSQSYSEYERVFTSQPDLCLYGPTVSTQLRDSRQLVELGIMSNGQEMTEAGRSRTPLTIDEYLAHMHELVPGWFDDVDAAVFRAIDQVQRATSVHGDLLEIGAYLGKSAILLGYLLRPEEQLVVCDLFTNDDLDPDLDADAALYDELSRAAFEESYGRFHRRPPRVIERSSTELLDEGLTRSFRLIHVDGSHRYGIVRQDIDTALELVVEGGVIIVDDYRTLPHALGVAAGVWEAVTDGRLIPLLATVQKFYGCAPGSADTRTAHLLRRWALEEVPSAGSLQHVAGHDAVVFAPPMTAATVAPAEQFQEAEQSQRQAENEVARLQERLALIERSRTWRVRSRVMRLIRRRSA